MKPLYFFLFLFVLLLAGYLLLNDFSFDNTTFSNYLINTLFILVLACAGIIGVLYLVNQKRKNAKSGFMTIRQYYDYRSAR